MVTRALAGVGGGCVEGEARWGAAGAGTALGRWQLGCSWT